MAEIRVGISGWNYPRWRGNFYPSRLTQQLELAYASRRFNAIEINGTFYSLQRPSSFRAWYVLGIGPRESASRVLTDLGIKPSAGQ